MSQCVLQIAPSLEFDGSCQQMALLSQQLARRGFSVRIVSVGGPGPMAETLERAGIRVGWIKPDLCRVPHQIAQLRRRLLDDFEPDIVHTWGRPADLYGRLAAIALRRSRVIASYQESTVGRGLLEQQLDHQLMRRTDAVVVDRDTLRQTLNRWPRVVGKTHVIPSGVEAAPAVTAERRKDVLAAWGIPPTARVIAAAGPLLPSQRIKDLIWATDLLKTIRDDIYFVVSGRGPHQWRLMRYRDQVRIADHVKMIGGGHDLAEYMGVFDGLWHAARDGCVPLAVLQAMAAGVPVVVGDTPVNRECVVPDETGCVVAVGDRTGFARAALRLLDDAALSKRLSAAARTYVADHHDMTSMVDRYVAAYQGLLVNAAA